MQTDGNPNPRCNCVIKLLAVEENGTWQFVPTPEHLKHMESEGYYLNDGVEQPSLFEETDND